MPHGFDGFEQTVRQQLRSLEPQGVGLRRKFATERDLGLQQSLVSLHPKTPTGYRCGKCEHRKYSYSGTGDIQRPAQLTHIFAAQLVFADPSNGGRKVKYSLAKLRVAQCQIVATARPAQIDIQRLSVKTPAQLFAERRRNSPVEVAGLAVPGKFAARECDQDPIGRAILDPPQSFLLAPVRARPFRAGEQHQPFRATEMVDDFPPEVWVRGESGCVTKDIDGPQREQRFGELFHSRFESLGQLVIGTMIIGNKRVVLDLHCIPRNTEVIETELATSGQSMSLTSKVATNVSCGGRCLRALPRREFGEPKRRVSHRSSASKHADAFASTQLVGVTFDCFHLAVRLRDHKADMAVSIPRIDEEQMTGLDLIGITSGDLKWNATEPSSTRLL